MKKKRPALAAPKKTKYRLALDKIAELEGRIKGLGFDLGNANEAMIRMEAEKRLWAQRFDGLAGGLTHMSKNGVTVEIKTVFADTKRISSDGVNMEKRSI